MVSKGYYFLGVDVGSISVNTVVVNGNRDILEEYYTRTHGQPLVTVYQVLKEILSRISPSQLLGISLTGSGGKLIAELLGAVFENEIIAQSKSIEYFYPQVKTVIEMGGEDSKLISLGFDEKSGKIKISDFAMNSICAAGTGSFLDQQAHRLGLTIEEFGQLALRSKSPPRIAGRCSVFAKTDMIHLQQVATPDYDIVAGLCVAVARNFKSTLGRGKSFVRPVSFQGGVAANLGMRKAFLKVLELSESELIIPKYFASMGAIGAALLTMENPSFSNTFNGLEKLADYISSLSHKKIKGLEPLTPFMKSKKTKQTTYASPLNSGEKIRAYLGVDVGSISTNVVVIDDQNKVLSKRYLMTAGRPLEAIKKGLREVGEEVGDKVWVVAVGTTGSGRYLTGDFIGADVVKNEITAQATAAVDIDPEVDTIFEIGGQDSKYISLSKGAIVDFEMNKVCAAGTGSFLEEQAERLGISIKDEFSNLALAAPCPASLGERCTVFMGSDLVHHQQMGVDKANLVSGLSYSIVLNYLNKVVGDRRIGDHIFFQGGTAFNLGVVAAFEKILGKKITIPENHDVTGAIGAAILAREEKISGKSAFKGFDLSKRDYELTSFECKRCPNRCEIKRLKVKGERPLLYGSRCERFEVDRKKKRVNQFPDLFAEREHLLYQDSQGNNLFSEGTPQIGIPLSMFYHELFPFFYTFLRRLGFKVIVSDKTHKGIIHMGVESVVSETCFPIKVAHGHILNLIEKGVSKIFLPSIIDMERIHPEVNRSQVCPYVQALPYTLKSAFDFERLEVELVTPILYFGEGKDKVKKELHKVGKKLGKKSRVINQALDAAFDAQNQFYSSIKKRGKEILHQLKDNQIAMVIVSRPYNGCDVGINLNLPQKIADLGILAIPMDYLPLEESGLVSDWQEMYWKYGQRILSTTHFLKSHPSLHAIYLTNFGCGPDSFISHFFKEKMGEIPYLTIEIDEHSSDVGIITRIEAYLDSLKNIRKKPVRTVTRKSAAQGLPDKKRRIYIPNMADHSYAIVAAFEACGLEATVLPESDEETLRWGRKLTSGRECYPCILTTGDMIKMTQKAEFDPDRAAFFMASGRGPCRFGQYNRFHRLVLDEMGFSQVPIFAPDQDEYLYRELGEVGKGFSRLAWKGVVSVDLLQKRLREVRPYEKHLGESEELYQHYLEKICQAIRKRQAISPLIKKASVDFNTIEVTSDGRKPIIGIVGEIYIRSNRFSNEDLVRNIEQLGCEVWLPPIAEWILYTNYTSKRRSLRTGNYRNFLATFLTNEVQKAVEHRLMRNFKKSLRVHSEPKTEEIIRNATAYLHPSFEGEAILSIGKAVDFTQKGASGLINTMPFTCMPGTIVNAVLKRCREAHNNVPLLNIAYDGQKESNTKTRLEAFVYQVRQYQERMNSSTT
ncbi:MAG: CoA activase [Deltaproteobacteria bacterium DG_8]|nr:MAG: CoA activase [Deltaproteobacteria bacterium DG_8]